MFRVGDLVRLRSGGPAMTVEDVSPDVVAVAWMHDGKMHHDVLPAEAVVLVKAPVSGPGRAKPPPA